MLKKEYATKRGAQTAARNYKRNNKAVTDVFSSYLKNKDGSIKRRRNVAITNVFSFYLLD